MKEIKLKGYKENFKGTRTNPTTEIQKSIFEAIAIALGEVYNADNYTSYTAWGIISQYADRITLRYYTNDKKEHPTICIDGEEVYKKGEYKTKGNINDIKPIEVDDLDI